MNNIGTEKDGREDNRVGGTGRLGAVEFQIDEKYVAPGRAWRWAGATWLTT